MASQPYTICAQLSAAEVGCKSRLVLQNDSLETGSLRIIPNSFFDGTETEDGKEIELKPARGRMSGQEGQGKGKARVRQPPALLGCIMPQPKNFDWISASKLKFHSPSAVGPESVAVQLRANPGPFGPPKHDSVIRHSPDMLHYTPP